jgi:WD40 repeat protein
MRYAVSTLLIAAIAIQVGCQQPTESTDAGEGTQPLTSNTDSSESDGAMDGMEPSSGNGADEPAQSRETPTTTAAAKEPAWVFKQILRKHEDWVRDVAFSPDSKLMASGSDDSKIHIWDTSNWQLLRTLDTETNVRGVAYSKDGKTIVMSGFGSVYVLDAESGETRHKLAFHVIYDFSYEPEQNLVAACADEESKVWNAGSGEEVATFGGHTELISCVALSKLGVLASGSHDKLIKLWDLKTKEEIGVLEGQDGWLACLAFSPDGKTLASGGHNSTIVLWDVEGRKEIKRLECQDTPMALAFSSDAATLVEGRWDGNVYIWDIASGENVLTLEDPEGRISGVAISPDGKHLATAELGATITVWENE